MPNPNYLPGPEPILTPPPLAQAIAAEEALRAANATNKKAGALVAGISPEQAETLLAWMVHRTRMRLLPRDIAPESTEAKEWFSDPYRLYPRCGVGRDAIGVMAQQLGITAYSHQLADVKSLSIGSFMHAFSVVTFPMQQPDGAVALAPYLVDTTLRQFFATEKDAYFRHPTWGAQMAKSDAGQALGDQLLLHGFAPLTPHNAEIYVASSQIHPLTHEWHPEVDPHLVDILTEEANKFKGPREIEADDARFYPPSGARANTVAPPPQPDAQIRGGTHDRASWPQQEIE